MYEKREVTTEGIVIGRASAGEGSARITLYTRELGLVSALAKSAREERSKLRMHLQVGTLGDFTLVKGRDVWRVTGIAGGANSHFELSGSRSAQKAAARVLGSVRQFVHGEHADPYLFTVLWRFFSLLRSFSEEQIPAAEGLAVLRMLWALGYVPENELTAEFLSQEYDAPLLARAGAKRLGIIRAINGAISASGL